MNAIDYLRGLSRAERAVIAKAAGYSPAYINKVTSIGGPYVPITLALGCAEHSLGVVSFWESIDPRISKQIDWSALRLQINEFLRLKDAGLNPHSPSPKRTQRAAAKVRPPG